MTTEAQVRAIIREELRPFEAFRKDLLQRFTKLGVALRDRIELDHGRLKFRDDAEQPVQNDLVGDNIPVGTQSADSSALELLSRAGFFRQRDSGISEDRATSTDTTRRLDTPTEGDLLACLSAPAARGCSSFIHPT